MSERRFFLARAGAALALTGTLHATTLHAAPPVVLVTGDSLSAAYGMNSREGWVALMQGELGSAARVVNVSVSGETTLGARARIEADLARTKPAVVLIALGGNDGLRGLPVKDTRANLAFMVRAAKAKGAQVVLAGMQIPPNYGLDYAREFRELYGALATEQRVGLIPFLLDGLADKLEWFQPDKIHPTVAAQPLILKNALPHVQRALTDSATRTRRVAVKP